MSVRTIIAFSLLGVATIARAEVSVVVELVPDNPGPYTGGESLDVDVWLHSQVSEDVRPLHIQFDFSDTSAALLLAPTFTFDFGDIPDEVNYYLQAHVPELPVPWTHNGVACYCPELFLLLEGGGSLHIGNIAVELPTSTGTYRLDAFNVGESDPAAGATLGVWYTSLGPVWRAFTGELAGGRFDFEVAPPIPTVSGVGMIAMTVLLLLFGGKIIARRNQMVTGKASFSRPGRPSLPLLTSPIALLFAINAAALAQPAVVPSEIETHIPEIPPRTPLRRWKRHP